MQKMLNENGYNVGAEDGIVGSKFISGLGKYLKAKGYYSGSATKLDKALVTAWQKYITKYFAK